MQNKQQQTKQDIKAVLEQKPEFKTNKDYYCLLTHGYETEKCSSMEDAMQKIETYLKKFNLSYKQVFNQCNGAMQVIVYQYSTLYTETFIIHRTREFL